MDVNPIYNNALSVSIRLVLFISSLKFYGLSQNMNML